MQCGLRQWSCLSIVFNLHFLQAAGSTKRGLPIGNVGHFRSLQQRRINFPCQISILSPRILIDSDVPARQEPSVSVRALIFTFWFALFGSLHRYEEIISQILIPLKITLFAR